jgi:hypothetical protein
VSHIKWIEDSKFVHRLFIVGQYIGKLHFTVDGDVVVSCQFVRSPDHKRIPISMTKLMLMSAKCEVIQMLTHKEILTGLSETSCQKSSQ